MAFRLTSLIVAGCLMSLAQLLHPSSKAIAANALFSQPRITAAIAKQNWFQSQTMSSKPSTPQMIVGLSPMTSL